MKTKNRLYRAERPDSLKILRDDRDDPDDYMESRLRATSDTGFRMKQRQSYNLTRIRKLRHCFPNQFVVGISCRVFKCQTLMYSNEISTKLYQTKGQKVIS